MELHRKEVVLSRVRGRRLRNYYAGREAVASYRRRGELIAPYKEAVNVAPSRPVAAAITCRGNDLSDKRPAPVASRKSRRRNGTLVCLSLSGIGRTVRRSSLKA